MTTANIIGIQSLGTLKAMIAGDVFAPGDAGYDEARQAWELTADQRPAVVVFAESAVDVVRAVRFARSAGLRIAPQSTGHGSLPLEVLDGAMLLKTSRMRAVDIDPASGIARAEAGAEWEDVTAPAGKYGLAALAGSSPNVGVTGYTLGGGMGWLARRYGLAANSVTAVELVTPDGRLVRADGEHEPELFWAIRGGGGSVGVVTALEMKLYRVPELYAGALFFPIERSADVLQAWRSWTETVPEELTSLGRVLRLPALPEVPAALRGRAFALVEAAYLGDVRSGADLIRPLRDLTPAFDTFAMTAAPALRELHMDPEEPVPGVGDGMFLSAAPSAAIDAIVAHVGPGVDTPITTVEVRHLGGALAREAPNAGAQPKIEAEYVMFAGGFAPTPQAGDDVRKHVQALKDALAPWHAGYDYYNFVETPAEAEIVLSHASYQRLQQIKTTYDPEQTIISAHPVRPTAH